MIKNKKSSSSYLHLFFLTLPFVSNCIPVYSTIFRSNPNIPEIRVIRLRTLIFG